MRQSDCGAELLGAETHRQSQSSAAQAFSGGPRCFSAPVRRAEEPPDCRPHFEGLGSQHQIDPKSKWPQMLGKGKLTSLELVEILYDF